MSADRSERRQFIGFDTFEGHLEPTQDEFDVRGKNMKEAFFEAIEVDGSWCKADYQETLNFLNKRLKPYQSLTLHKGDVKEILPSLTVEPIAVLRIDCDWYPESIASLKYLYNSLSRGGVLILDDFGHHSGQRKAFEEYSEIHSLKWTHVNYSAITAVKI
jgi:hypothetical protein